jgi:hypothetical protein
MAVMVTFTLGTEPATYQALHGQMLALAKSAGMLFHSSHEKDGQVAIVDFWPSAEAWQSFMEGPLGEGMMAAGVPMPSDLEVTPLLNADG